MKASTIKNGNDRLRKGNRWRRRPREPHEAIALTRQKNSLRVRGRRFERFVVVVCQTKAGVMAENVNTRQWIFLSL